MQVLNADIGRLNVGKRTWRETRLSCTDTVATSERIACSRGVLELPEKIPVAFTYAFPSRELAVELKPAADEAWRATGRFGSGPAAVAVQIERGRLERVMQFVPLGGVKLTGGRASGSLTLQGEALKAQLNVEGAAFSDAVGLHAGEKISGRLEADAVTRKDTWLWNAALTWSAGEVFWQPFFFAAKEQRLVMKGTTTPASTQVSSGRLELPAIGAVEFSGHWNESQGGLVALEARANRVAVAGLYTQLLKPLFEGTALSDLRADGQATVALRVAGSALAALDLTLDGVSFEDRQRRFALFGVTGRVPWRRDEPSVGELAVKGAEFLKVPVGATRVPLQMKGMRVAIDRLRVPLFDGAVVLRDFATIQAKDGWRWRFSGEVEPISMTQLTQALGWPTMHGLLAGNIPELRYRRGTLSMDGALAVNVFNGTVWAKNLELIEPFGRAPRLHADLEMSNLDLELLTRTFDFGTITGRIDAQVKALELVGWEPTRFDARIASSPGTYPRRISQRAVQNISALGGAGAAAAIQRSLLRFFETFGYEKLGISCRLQDGVCEMDGIERAPQGYVIVKGGGIPAISVLGYNRAVDWSELIARLKRITQENVKPIVK